MFPQKLPNLMSTSLPGFGISFTMARVMDACEKIAMSRVKFFHMPRKGCISVLFKATAAMNSMTMQHCGPHLASSYHRSGVRAYLAGQEMGSNVRNAKKL